MACQKQDETWPRFFCANSSAKSHDRPTKTCSFVSE